MPLGDTVPMGPGQRASLKGDPGKVGILTGRRRDGPGVPYVQIMFPAGTEYVPQDQIDIVEEIQEPLELLAAGKLGCSRDLRRALTHVRLNGRLADVIYSMDITGTDFYAYQFKSVIKL